MKPTEELSNTTYQPLASTSSESLFALYEDIIYQPDSYVTTDQVSSTTEVPHFDYDEEQILILIRANNSSPSPRPASVISPRDIMNVNEITATNILRCRVVNQLICHHCYTTGHVSPECTLLLNKIQNVVTKYENNLLKERPRPGHKL